MSDVTQQGQWEKQSIIMHSFKKVKDDLIKHYECTSVFCGNKRKFEGLCLFLLC